MYGIKSRSEMIKHNEKPFSFQQSNIDKHIKNKLNYFRNVQRQLDAHATKAASIALRKNWMEKQKKSIIKTNMIALKERLSIVQSEDYLQQH